MIFNPFKPHKVQFSNGKYGIRRWRLGWEYLDLMTHEYWWGKNYTCFKYCQAKDEPEINNYIITDKRL